MKTEESNFIETTTCLPLSLFCFTFVFIFISRPRLDSAVAI